MARTGRTFPTRSHVNYQSRNIYFPLAYVMTAAVATFTLTGIDALFRYFTMTADTAAFVLTGVSANLAKNYYLLAETVSFALNGLAVRFPTVYSALTKNTTAYTPLSKNTTVYSDIAKNTTTYTPLDKSNPN